MSNLISFKPKFTLEQKQTIYLREKLEEIMNNPLSLSGWFHRPLLGSTFWIDAFDTALAASAYSLMEALIDELGDGSKEQSEATFKTFIGLIEWMQADKEYGDKYVVTMAWGDDNVAQYILLYVNNDDCGDYALLNFYDNVKDIASGIIYALNDKGMVNLGYVSN